jgi:hypothetical protein
MIDMPLDTASRQGPRSPRAKIRGALQEIKTAMRNALRIAIDAGDAFNAAKQQVPDGEWGRWFCW